MARSRGRSILGVIFTLFGLNAWLQVLNAVLGGNDDPAALTVLQTLVGAAGLAAALGSWRGTPWAPAAAAIYGAVTATMLACVGPLLGLAAEEQRGIWTGAVAVLLFGGWSAWYLRRQLHQDSPHR